MRHQKAKNLRFSGKQGHHRDAMLRNLLTSFCLHKAIVTTEKRARALSGIVDSMIRFVNTHNTMNAIRHVQEYVTTEVSSKELMENIAPQYKDRQSGCTRITAIKYRDGDSAKLVKIELI